MEEIIEIFADSISSFIMLSIKLQETNAAPADAMRPAAAGVAQAAGVLVTIANEKGTLHRLADASIAFAATHSILSLFPLSP
jgi:hypothetical protein